MDAMIAIVADILTAIGFLITCWIAISLSQLRKSYAFKGRHPEITKDIRKYSSQLSQLLDSRNLDEKESEVVLRRCRSTLKALSRLIPRHDVKPVKEAEKAIVSCIKVKKTSDRELIRDIHNKLVSVESDLENIKKDEKWRLPR